MKLIPMQVTIDRPAPKPADNKPDIFQLFQERKHLPSGTVILRALDEQEMTAIRSLAWSAGTPIRAFATERNSFGAPIRFSIMRSDYWF